MLLNKHAPAFNRIPPSLASGIISTVASKLDSGIRLHSLTIKFGNDGATNPEQGLGAPGAPGMIDKIRVLWGGKVNAGSRPFNY